MKILDCLDKKPCFLVCPSIVYQNIMVWKLKRRGEGTNSARLFTPGERKAPAKSKVHQGSRARDYGSWVDLLTDLKNMAVCQEWDKQDFNFHLENHVSHNEL